MFTGIFVKAQRNTELFPDELNIQPFTANMLEPKLGFLIHTSENQLRLDIGNTMDIVKLALNCEESLSIGADLFTYTMLRGETNFHFPVDAVDYLFGLNVGYKKVYGNKEFGGRFRVSHISAHFVDGHYDGPNQRWRDNLNPRVYSREFLELMPFYKFGNFRVYTGFSYLFHIDPADLGKDSYQAGFEYFFPNLLHTNITPFIGYDFKVIHLKKYSSNNSAVLGLKFGKFYGRGLSLYFTFYSGNNIHGEYYDYNSQYSALGINLDL